MKMKTLLVVDDHPLTREGVAKALRMMPEVDLVVEAGDGDRAVELVHEARPDLVLLDLDLPSEGGLTLIARIKRTRAACRVLVVSGLDARLYGGRAMRMGAEGFVSKTAQLKTLLDAVEMVRAGFRVFPDEVNEAASSAACQQIATAQDLVRQARLTDRERLVINLLAKGLSNKTHWRATTSGCENRQHLQVGLMKKLGVTHVIELADLVARCQ